MRKRFMHRFRNHADGFTLVELLIVIAVIGLLSAILLPVLSRARESAKTKVCLSNLKQLGLAFQQYTQDNGRRYPYPANYQDWAKGGHWITGGKPGAGGTLVAENLTTGGNGLLASTALKAPYRSPYVAIPEQGALFPYVKSAQAYVCPSTEDSRSKRLSYSMNCAIGGMSDVRMTEPSSIIVLVDEGPTLNDGFFYAVKDANDELTQAHNGGGNLLFGDGHAKFFVWSTFSVGTSPDNNALRTRIDGIPRFHDKVFGTGGTYRNACTPWVP